MEDHGSLTLCCRFIIHISSYHISVHCINSAVDAEYLSFALQVLDPSGRFLRAFGSQGTADGRFNYPWGITTDALGFIYVCDKENHRVQVTEYWTSSWFGR